MLLESVVGELEALLGAIWPQVPENKMISFLNDLISGFELTCTCFHGQPPHIRQIQFSKSSSRGLRRKTASRSTQSQGWPAVVKHIQNKNYDPDSTPWMWCFKASRISPNAILIIMLWHKTELLLCVDVLSPQPNPKITKSKHFGLRWGEAVTRLWIFFSEQVDKKSHLALSFQLGKPAENAQPARPSSNHTNFANHSEKKIGLNAMFNMFNIPFLIPVYPI